MSAIRFFTDEPLQQQLTPGDRGLDFGSGPGPTLSRMLTEAGFPTTIYDPFYAPDADVGMVAYDFITASQVVGTPAPSAV